MNENNIEHFIEYNDIMNSKSIICDVCGRFNITKGECPKKEFLSLGYKNVNNKCYCSDCYKQYVMITNDDAKINKRPTKHQYYLNIAKVVASRSTCLRKKYGAILVKNDIIISTGYNGSPRGTANCIDLNKCRREDLNIPRGQCYEMCRSVHAEQNCIINASRSGMLKSTLYLYGINSKDESLVENLDSCQLCKKLIINSGISEVIIPKSDNDYKIIMTQSWVDNDETLTNKFGY